MELITLATDIGLINKAGAWYTLSFLKDEKNKFQGTEKIRNFLLENDEAYTELYKQVKQMLGTKF
jgi:formiminotetrahydrofolate cyclodeaminase